MVELFSIGGFSIYLFGAAIALGIMCGMFIMSREAERKGLDKDNMFNLAVYTVIAAVAGARLYYILAFNLGYYIENPMEILKISTGGLSIQGGLFGGILFAIWYTKRKNISFLKAADSFAPAIAMGQAIGRIGCDVFGNPMQRIYPWGIEVNSQILHPAQMYEMILDLILFAFLWSRRGKEKYNGQIFISYLTGFSVNRAVVEFFRTNPIVIGPLTVAHVTSFVILAAAVIAGYIIKKRQYKLNIDVESVKIRVNSYEYILVVLLGVAGMIFYYFIH